MKDFLARLSSRKFLLTLGGVIFYLLGGALGHFEWDVVVDSVLKVIGLYVGIEGLADIVSRAKK